jgi:hypothetical protein
MPQAAVVIRRETVALLDDMLLLVAPSAVPILHEKRCEYTGIPPVLLFFLHSERA